MLPVSLHRQVAGAQPAVGPAPGRHRASAAVSRVQAKRLKASSNGKTATGGSPGVHTARCSNSIAGTCTELFSDQLAWRCCAICRTQAAVPRDPTVGTYAAPAQGSPNTENLKQRNLALEIVRVTEAAALAAGRWYGKVSWLAWLQAQPAVDPDLPLARAAGRQELCRPGAEPNHC